MTETKPSYTHGDSASPLTCPTCGTPVRIVESPYAGDLKTMHYEPIGLSDLERAVVEKTTAWVKAEMFKDANLEDQDGYLSEMNALNDVRMATIHLLTAQGADFAAIIGPEAAARAAEAEVRG